MCPKSWQNPQNGWCTDPVNGNGYTIAEAKRIARDRNGGNGAIWGDIIGGVTDLTEILFGDGNTNDTTVVQPPPQNNGLGIWMGVGIVIVILLLAFLILRR